MRENIAAAPRHPNIEQNLYMSPSATKFVTWPFVTYSLLLVSVCSLGAYL